MLAASDDSDIDKFTDIISGIYNSGDITDELSTCIFIEPPKEQCENKCDLP